MNLALFYVWEDARVWALWNHASDAHLSYLGQGPALPLLESPQGMADILYLLPWRAAFFIHNNWKSKSKVSAELIPPEDSQVALVVKKNKATCQCRRHKRRVFSPWVRKIPWWRAQQPTPVFLPGKSHGQRSPVGYSLWGRRVRRDWSHLACTHTCGVWERNVSMLLSWPLMLCSQSLVSLGL